MTPLQYDGEAPICFAPIGAYHKNHTALRMPGKDNTQGPLLLNYFNFNISMDEYSAVPL